MFGVQDLQVYFLKFCSPFNFLLLIQLRMIISLNYTTIHIPFPLSFIARINPIDNYTISAGSVIHVIQLELAYKLRYRYLLNKKADSQTATVMKS